MSEFLRQPSLRRGAGLLMYGLAGSLALAGCGDSEPPVTEGTITAKAHVEAHTTLIPFRTCRRIGKITSCTTTFIPVHHAEHYDLTIQNCAMPHETASKCPEAVTQVPQQTYDSVHVGERYVIPQQPDAS